MWAEGGRPLGGKKREGAKAVGFGDVAGDAQLLHGAWTRRAPQGGRKGGGRAGRTAGRRRGIHGRD